MSDPQKILLTKEAQSLFDTRRWTADPHFGHKNIIKYCGRPFLDVPKMDNVLIDKWNEGATKDSITVVIGDFAFASEERQKDIMKNLLGKKILVRGNHDEHYPFQKYFDIGWDEVHADIWMTRLANGRPVGISHDPAKSVMDRQLPWIVGHLHELFILFGNCLNVGVDVWDFKPVSELKVCEYVQRMQFGKGPFHQ